MDLKLILIGAISLALIGTGYYTSSVISASAAKSARIEVLEAASERAARRAKSDAKALVAREAKIASTARKLAASEQALQNALQRNNDWSNTNVPTDIQRALGGAGSGLPVDLDGLFYGDNSTGAPEP